MAGLNEVTELAKNASVKIVFSTTEYKGATYIDMREYVTGPNYTGFTKKGIRLLGDRLDEFIEKLRELRAALPKATEKEKSPEED